MATIHTNDTAHGRDVFGRFDWSAILASVFAGLGVTLLLVALGAAAGIEAGDDAANDNAGMIGTALGTWTVVSALIGTLVGTFIGGRYSRWRTTGSALYHGLVSWSVVAITSALLGGSGVLGLMGSAMQRRDVANQNTGEQAAANANVPADAISWGGWALAAGLGLTLLVSLIGWYIGSRTKLAGFEASDGDHTHVETTHGRRVTS